MQVAATAPALAAPKAEGVAAGAVPGGAAAGVGGGAGGGGAVTPGGERGLWLLLCRELGLSDDQEEEVRSRVLCFGVHVVQVQWVCCIVLLPLSQK